MRSRHLRSVACHQLTVPRHRFSTYGPRTFNTQPADLPTATFGQLLKTHLSLPISTFSALGVSHIMRFINVHYLLTYSLLYNLVNNFTITTGL